MTHRWASRATRIGVAAWLVFATACGDDGSSESGATTGGSASGGTSSRSGGSSGASGTPSSGGATGATTGSGGTDGSSGAGEGGETSASGGTSAGSDAGGGEAGNDGGAVTASGGSSQVAGSGGVGGQTPGVVEIDEFCERFADAVCAYLMRCVGYADRDACEVWGRWPAVVATCADGLDAIDAGRIVFDGFAGEACLVAHESGACLGPPPFVAAANTGVGDCAGVFDGTVPPDGDCYADSNAFSDECSEGSYCDESTACPGSCVEFTALGDACDGVVPCDPSLGYCDETCTAFAGRDEPCGETPCEPSLTCLQITGLCGDRRAEGETCAGSDCGGSLFCAGGECQPIPGEDEPCLEPDEGDPVCGARLICYEDVCSAEVPSGAPCSADTQCPEGEACLSSEDGIVCREPSELDGFCQSDRDCQTALACVSGACIQPSALDGPCLVFDAPTCEEGLFCDRELETCQEPRGEDEACNPSVPTLSCEPGLYCECTADPPCSVINSSANATDLCVPVRANGELCANGHECESGYCEFSGGGEPECRDPMDTTAPPGCFGPE